MTPRPKAKPTSPKPTSPKPTSMGPLGPKAAVGAAAAKAQAQAKAQAKQPPAKPAGKPTSMGPLGPRGPKPTRPTTPARSMGRIDPTLKAQAHADKTKAMMQKASAAGRPAPSAPVGGAGPSASDRAAKMQSMVKKPLGMKKGGACKKYARGGGIEVRGKTKGKII